MRRQDKKINMETANKRLLGESFQEIEDTTIDIDNHIPVVKENHVSNDDDKIEYIKGALKNLNSTDLNRIYLSVEKYDPEYTHGK